MDILASLNLHIYLSHWTKMLVFNGEILFDDHCSVIVVSDPGFDSWLDRLSKITIQSLDVLERSHQSFYTHSKEYLSIRLDK